MRRDPIRRVYIMMIPCGFKIRKKADTKFFTEKCMQKDSEYYLKIDTDFALILEKEKDGECSVAIKRGDLQDYFNPLLEVANTNNNAYKETVYDYIWKYRKYINAKWFNN